MEQEDIIPEGLEGKTERERLAIIESWEHLHDLKKDILDGKSPEEGKQLSEIESELDRLSKHLAPKEPVPESGILIKGRKRYVLCPRCGTFVHLTKKRVDEVVLAFEEKPEEGQPTSKYLLKSINCPICKWGLGIPEE
jgi:hypothetical protein